MIFSTVHNLATITIMILFNTLDKNEYFLEINELLAVVDETNVKTVQKI